MRASRSALALASAGKDRSGIDERDLLRDLTVARDLATPIKCRELVPEGCQVIDLGVDDTEADVAHRIHLGETLEDHLPNALRADLGRAARLQSHLHVVDERSELLARATL